MEFASLAPAPFAVMLLADMGADVVCVDRRNGVRSNILGRGRRSVVLDLKTPLGVSAARELVKGADVLVEGFRPGVMERLGLGPDICCADNPRLVYARMTGWGQSGPLAAAAGHDINYISLTGALEGIGYPDGKPAPPLTLVGDFGGGGAFLAIGILAALLERQRSGLGQVVDAAMVDGANALMTIFHEFAAEGKWGPRGQNTADGGAPLYAVYETSDGKYISLGTLEPQFFALLRQKLSLTDSLWDDPWDRARWPVLIQRLTALFKTRSRAEWCALLEGSDVCFAPVLALPEVAAHPQSRARDAFVTVDGLQQPAPAPRFSRTPSRIGPRTIAGAHTTEVLSKAGLAAALIRKIEQANARAAGRPAGEG